MNTTVTIGMCVKNCEETINDAIESIISQDYPHKFIEIIIVDNGSNDKTLSIINKRKSKMDFPFRVFHANRQGMGKIRQIIVDNALGKYILWVDGDIKLPKDYLRRQVEFMERNPRIGIILGKMEGLGKETLCSTLENIARSSDYRVNFRKSTPPRFGTGGSLFRVKALRQVGGFDKNIIGAGEDKEVVIRIKKAGWSHFSSEIIFYNKFRESWKDMINQQLWYGYGAHYLRHKCKENVVPWVEIPLIAFMDGFMRSIKAYRMIYQKNVFLLPIYNFAKRIAYWFGFIKSHMDNYGHEIN